MTTYILGSIAIIVLTPTFLAIGSLLLHLCHCFIGELPGEEKPMEHETPDEYCGCDKPGMARVDVFRFRKMPCGHDLFEWSDLKQQCLQCVAEGRQVAKDLGRVKRQ